MLGNDTDVDNGTNLLVTAVGTGGTTGAVAIAADGKGVTYDPTGRFDLAGGVTETDTFSYTVSDGQGGSDTATVAVTVTGVGEPPPPPTANDDAFTVGEDSAPAAFRILGNDNDFDGGKAGLKLIGIDTAGTLGIVETTSGGRIVYDPNDVFESLAKGDTVPDSFTYTIQNAAGAQATATVVMTIEGANDKPVAIADPSFTVDRNEVGAELDVLLNDTDVDREDPLTITSVSKAAAGTVDISDDGKLLFYTPPDDEAKVLDIFTYTISDEDGATSSATVTVAINDQIGQELAGTDFMF